MTKPISEIIGSFRYAQLLLTAARLKVYSALHAKPQKVSELATTLDVDERGLRIICDALVSHGHLAKNKEILSCPQESFEAFVEGGENSRENTCLFSFNQYQRWGALYDAITSGEVQNANPLEVEVTKSNFGRALDRGAKGSAKQTAEKLDLTNTSSMLDIGGGSGRYVISFAEKYPDLNVTIFDHPDMIKVARKNIEESNISSRVSYIEGDIFSDAPDKQYDFVLLSNVVHMFSMEENLTLFSRIKSWIKPGALVCVKDFKLNSSRTEPTASAMFALHMYLYGTGDCYNTQEVEQMFAAAGVDYERSIDVGESSVLLLGRAQN